MFAQMLHASPALAAEHNQDHEMLMEVAVEGAVYHAWYTFSMVAADVLKIVAQIGFLVWVGTYDGGL